MEGFVERGFEVVRDAFAHAQEGDEGAAQLCVYHRGRVVADLWTGQDPVSGKVWDAESLSVLMSVSKGVTATCVHMLVERGQLELSAPVKEYWPEFAVGGKADISVADLQVCKITHLPMRRSQKRMGRPMGCAVKFETSCDRLDFGRSWQS